MAGIARQVALHRSAGAAALRVDLRRRDDGDRARPWARRPQRRVSAGSGDRTERIAQRVYALAGDTDGVDGAEEIAGAIVAPDTLARAAALGINAKARLADNDGHGFFEALGDQVVTGPTLTNVNDFRAILVDK